MHLVKPVVSYLDHMLRAKNEHGLHSPFVYQLYTQIIRGKGAEAETGSIEVLRAELARRKERIVVNDLGAGSRLSSSNERSIASIVNTAAISRKDGELLYRLCSHIKPKTILELGTNLGLGIAYMAKACPKANIRTIEGCKNIHALATSNLKHLGISNVGCIQGAFDDKMEDQLAQLYQVDLLVLDGDHRYESTIRYLKKAIPYLKEGSLVLVDDIHWSTGMEKAWNEIIEMKEFNVTIDLFDMGLAFIRSDQAAQHFKVKR